MKAADDNPYDAPQAPSKIDPDLGTERRPTIGGWRDLFITRAALAVIVLFWVAFLAGVVWWLMPR
jgi:hypothetical protein